MTGCCDSVDYDLGLFLTNSGVPPSKLGIGLAFFGDLATGQVVPNSAYRTPTFTERNYNYVLSHYDVSGATIDPSAQVPWISVSSNSWLNWDNPQSIEAKVAYAKSKNIGGWAIWYLGMDDFPAATPPQPLLNAVKLGMQLGPAPPTNLKVIVNIKSGTVY